MRVLHLLASNGWGGAERIACTVHRLARDHGHTSMIDAPARQELLDGVSDETGDGTATSGLERHHPIWALAARRRRKRFAPDVVHAHLASPGLASAAWLIAGSAPLVVTFHLLPRTVRWPNDYFMPVSSPRVLGALSRRKSRQIYVAVSAGDAERISGYVPGCETAVALNAPPLPPFRARPRQELAFPDGVLRLLSVGRLNEQKGFERIVHALSDARVRELPWHWIIVGSGPEQARLESEISARGLKDRITLAGFMQSEGLFESADLILSPSRFEGMPLVPLEALLASRPVLLSRIPPHYEVLGAVPESFLPEDDAEWGAALAALLSDREALENLRTAQLAAAPKDPRERLWHDYSAIYERVLRG
ncbi:MAG TPA: glycosyltransferase family 4 protein [Polyangiaceae bacterium]|jgi:glycosyltransferase involved in cell wall biosynthesis|nr:glycosyltransferase family 4 protein [Polyangiaceae bacterium]